MLNPVKGLQMQKLAEGSFLIHFNNIIHHNRALEGCLWSFEKDALILNSIGENDNPMRVDLNWEGFQDLGDDTLYGPWLRALVSNWGASRPRKEPHSLPCRHNTTSNLSWGQNVFDTRLTVPTTWPTDAWGGGGSLDQCAPGATLAPTEPGTYEPTRPMLIDEALDSVPIQFSTATVRPPLSEAIELQHALGGVRGPGGDYQSSRPTQGQAAGLAGMPKYLTNYVELRKEGSYDKGSVFRCGCEAEDLLHKLLRCSFSLLVSTLSCVPWICISKDYDNSEEWLRGVHRGLDGSNFGWVMITCWFLWWARNQQIFENTPIVSGNLMKRVINFEGSCREVLHRGRGTRECSTGFP
ncbi:hypothetical protein Salat_2783100 [Sesamum alatum]|uniref:Uncharacterized protein n=1 Tax=Sesamum alatum TaxID=300844 RepID=A0AAE2C990_9LAMI|nr:hypothetical protein Salat_2783100 [Sesamum alatum]